MSCNDDDDTPVKDSTTEQGIDDPNSDVNGNGDKTNPSTKVDALSGAFSVSENTYVYFSSGNLQYNASTDTYRFAENQYDIIGEDNEKIGQSDYTAWIDLFGWGIGDNPIDTSTNYLDYSEFVDWGKHIGDGNTWRTLSSGEWSYIKDRRPNAWKKYGEASVAGVYGLILLPDEFTLPTNLTFNSGIDNYTQNKYTVEYWAKMESAGAVFLPAAGYRHGSSVDGSRGFGFYWKSSSDESDYANCIFFHSNYAEFYGGNPRYVGQSVRLVQNQK